MLCFLVTITVNGEQSDVRVGIIILWCSPDFCRSISGNPMKKTIVLVSLALLALLLIGAGTNSPSSFSNPGVDSKSLANASFGFVDSHGNTRLGYGSKTDLSAASNCVI